MKILLVHNYYGSSAPSGENKVFEAERAMLEKYGHEVAVYTRHSDEIRNEPRNTLNTRNVGIVFWGGFRVFRVLSGVSKIYGLLKGALCTVGNPFAARAVARKCQEFKPDVVHFHNTFPFIELRYVHRIVHAPFYRVFLNCRLISIRRLRASNKDTRANHKRYN